MHHTLLVDPEVSLAALEDRLARLGWTVTRMRGRTLYLLHARVEVAATIRFHQVIRLCVVELVGPDALAAREWLERVLPVLDLRRIAELLASDDADEVTLGLLATEHQEQVELLADVRALGAHPTRVVRSLAQCVAERLQTLGHSGERAA